ncbi:MAG: hypothetical protein WKF61_06685 [Luteimonas sp.]
MCFITVVAGCSAEKVHCGGRIYPDQVGEDALKILKKTEAESKEFCSEPGAGCDFTVAKTRQGWSVAATRTFAADGKCASRIGDEKFYSYDNSGSLIRVIDGM